MISLVVAGRAMLFGTRTAGVSWGPAAAGSVGVGRWPYPDPRWDGRIRPGSRPRGGQPAEAVGARKSDGWPSRPSPTAGRPGCRSCLEPSAGRCGCRPRRAPCPRRSAWMPVVDGALPYPNHDPDWAGRKRTGQHGPAQTVAKHSSTIGAPRSHHLEDRGTCRERIKAGTGVSAGHGLDRWRARRDSNP
jgi:hypothetical protein